MTTRPTDSATRLPRDANGESVQAGGSDGTDTKTVQDGDPQSIAVPAGVLGADVYATNTGDNDLAVFSYYGSGTGQSGEGVAVPTAIQPIFVSCATAAALYVSGAGGAAKVCVIWRFGSNDDDKE